MQRSLARGSWLRTADCGHKDGQLANHSFLFRLIATPTLRHTDRIASATRVCDGLARNDGA
jgi:hypothetical protein